MTIARHTPTDPPALVPGEGYATLDRVVDATGIPLEEIRRLTTPGDHPWEIAVVHSIESNGHTFVNMVDLLLAEFALGRIGEGSEE